MPALREFHFPQPILPALHRVLAEQGQVVALVKPQFEAGREQIGEKRNHS